MLEVKGNQSMNRVMKTCMISVWQYQVKLYHITLGVIKMERNKDDEDESNGKEGEMITD